MGKSRRQRAPGIAGALAVLAAAAAGQAHAGPGDDGGTLGLIVENDLFYEADRDYTNGIQLSWVSPAGDTPAFARRLASALNPWFPERCEDEADKRCVVRASYALGQNMYTPRDITLVDPLLTDRPYAGWLYGSMGIVAQTFDGGWISRQDKLQLQVGVVGPASLTEESQKLIHEIIGAKEPMGWDAQLKNEPGLVVTFERSWRFRWSDLPLDLTADVIPHFGGALGNVSIYASGGATLALGWNLANDYGPPRIEPTATGASYFEPPDGVSFYVFASADGRVVGRNIFLDGNTWRDSRHVEKEILVLDGQVGLAFAYDRARLTFSHVFRTREFKGQSDPDEYGSVGVSLSF